MSVALDLPVIPLGEEATWQTLQEHLTEARTVSPFARTDSGLVFALRHADVDAILKSDAFEFGDLIASFGNYEGVFYDWWHRTISAFNPPAHTRLRRLLGGAFTPKRLKPLRQTIIDIVNEALDPCLEQGHVDIEQFAHVIPLRVMGDLLGIPREQQSMYEDLTQMVAMGFHNGTADEPELRKAVDDAVLQLDGYSRGLIEEKRRDPGPDLITAMLEERDGVDRLTEQELVDHIIFMLFAGHDTTKGALSIATMLMAKYPGQTDLLRQNPALARSAAEEVMRFESTVLFTTRQPVEDIEWHGQLLPKGIPVGQCLVSAGRDEEGMPDAGTFDITRSANRAIPFGSGIHFCLGVNLARAEIEEAVVALATRSRELGLDGEPQWSPFKSVRGFKELRVPVEAR
ncbi:cytochrome P450 [Nocardioides humi]|uniref:Cytochrome P450 n=1 Tax=Nocardioides humi TaxID=449461 RepID=A0ABN2BE86_9ACTN|nr:cytochrome P450 [Nocardioides humi]